jgi:UDP-N-acetylmuramyl tripeptide synthase
MAQMRTGSPPLSPTHRHRSPAELLARLSGRVSRAAGFGAGSSVPGIVLERLSPGYVRRRARALPGGVVAVSGTNGKTTTASMIRGVLREQGIETVGNETGANLGRGVATALLEASPFARVGVFEIDEAALPAMIPMLAPRVLVLTNVFRDQLDRFGETERVASLLRMAAESLPPGSTIVANADDPLLWHSVAHLHPVGFGLVPLESAPPGSEAEPEICPRCGSALTMLYRTIGHLGRARCEECGWASATPSYPARVLADGGMSGIIVDVRGDPITLPVGGSHNAYNAAAAVAATEALSIPSVRAAAALEEFHPRFGRSEELAVDGCRVVLELMKNPGGAAALVEKLSGDRSIGAVVVSVSDMDADGRDISWIWDVDFERLAAMELPMIAGGRRAADTAVRLKYAGAAPAQPEPDPEAAIQAGLSRCSAGRVMVVLATYTAMLDLRAAVHGKHDALRDAS